MTLRFGRLLSVLSMKRGELLETAATEEGGVSSMASLPRVNVKFSVGRVNACVAERDAVRLAAHLLDRESPAATRAAVRVIRAIHEQVLDAG